MFFYFDPLEQFDIISILPVFFAYSPTNLNIILFLNWFLIWGFINVATIKCDLSAFENKYSYSYNINLWILLNFYDVISGILNENIAVKKKVSLS